jgi:hypothetical protein
VACPSRIVPQDLVMLHEIDAIGSQPLERRVELSSALREI